MNGLEIADVRVISLPLKTRFRSVDNREMVIFRGSKRYAEFSPFVEYDDIEASSWLSAALEYANHDLPEIKRDWIGVNATLPAVNGEEILSVLENFPDFQTVKIKVADHEQSQAEDLARIRFVKEHFPLAKLRLDANGALSIQAALEMIIELGDIELEYFEQPVRTITELAKLRELIAKENLKTKIAADESIRRSTDPYLVAKEQAADIAVLKLQPLGGIRAATKIAQQIGLEVVVSSALESSLGISQGLHLAGSLDQLNYDCGLWTQNLLAQDIVANPLEVRSARIKVEQPEIDQAALEKFRAPKDREDFWLQRLRRCLELLES